MKTSQSGGEVTQGNVTAPRCDQPCRASPDLGGILTPSLASCVTLGKLVNLSELQFPLLLNVHLTGPWGKFSDMMRVADSA